MDKDWSIFKRKSSSASPFTFYGCLGEGKRPYEFAERHVGWIVEWHNYVECNILSWCFYFFRCCHAARLVKASKIFMADCTKASSRVRNQGVLRGFLIVIADEPATLKSGCFCKLIGAKEGRTFQLGGRFCNTFFFRMPSPNTLLACSFGVWGQLKSEKKKKAGFITPPPSTLLLGLKHVSINEAEKKQNGHKQ